MCSGDADGGVQVGRYYSVRWEEGAMKDYMDLLGVKRGYDG